MFTALGKVAVTTPGTLVRATVNTSNAAEHLGVHAYMIQALPGNAGNVYIGLSGLTRATWVDVISWLPPPTANFVFSFGGTISYAIAAVKMNDLWIDADNAGDGVLISCLE